MPGTFHDMTSFSTVLSTIFFDNRQKTKVLSAMVINREKLKGLNYLYENMNSGHKWIIFQ